MLRLCRLMAALVLATNSSQQQPVFRSGIDVVAYDFTAVDGDGRAITDLTAAEITLRVNGRPRPVLSVEFVAAPARAGVEAIAAPAPYSSNARAIASRTLILAIDDEHLPVGERGVINDLEALLDGLAPGDRAGLIALKGAGTRVEITTDIDAVRAALRGIAGKEQPRFGQFSVSPSESIAVLEGDRIVLQRVIARECGAGAGPACPDQVRFEAESNGNTFERTTRVTLEALRSLFENLAAVEGPKSVVVVSGGIFGTRRTRPLIEEAADAAARARVSVVALQQFDALGGTSDRQPSQTGLEDANRRGAGLQEVTDLTGGAFFRTAGSARPAVERIAAELAGYYLLTFEPGPGERSAALQRIELATTRAGVTLRARPRFAAAGAGSKDVPATRDALVRGSETHRALPLRVAAYAQQGPDSGTVKLVVLAESPAPSPHPIPARFALVTHDLKMGSQWTATLSTGGAPPVPTAASVPAGRYQLRVAAIGDDGSRGTIEHAVNAALTTAGPLQVSDLMLGAASGEAFSPRLSFDRADGAAVAYLELYGEPGSATVSVVLERAKTADGAAIETAPMTLRARGSSSQFATGGFALDALEPGDHVIRAIVHINGTAAARVVRTLRLRPASGPSR
ncbi:MAG: VWA domain-containing protein [Vicinamibacterales bacterium]